jgi:hypothetical protein
MKPAIDLTWVGGWVQAHQPHGWSLLALVLLFVLFAGTVGACIGDDT